MNNALREILVYIVLPIMAIAAAFAAFSGKVKVLGVLVMGLLVAAAFAFMPMGTVQQLGSAMAQALVSAFNGTLG
jgi:hypothetical protein